jgi:hypothetical protein
MKSVLNKKKILMIKILKKHLVQLMQNPQDNT